MQTIAITNLKGGVGKSTTAVTLADALARAGLRVLLIDADGQGHCAIYLGLDRGPGLSGVLTRTKHGGPPGREYAPVSDFILKDVRPGLDLITCDPSITLAEQQIGGEAMREMRLQRRLQEVTKDYDIALIDVGPKTDLLSTLALLAADRALVVTNPSTPEQSLRDVELRLDAMREEAGQGPEVMGILLTRVDMRENQSRRVSQAVAEHSPVPQVPVSADIAKSCEARKTVLELYPASAGAKAYQAVADWLQTELKVNHV